MPDAAACGKPSGAQEGHKGRVLRTSEAASPVIGPTKEGCITQVPPSVPVVCERSRRRIRTTCETPPDERRKTQPLLRGA